MSQFAFLQREWPEVYDAAARGEFAVHHDPRTACFYARRALELAVSWTYKHDAALKLPYDDRISALRRPPERFPAWRAASRSEMSAAATGA